MVCDGVDWGDVRRAVLELDELIPVWVLSFAAVEFVEFVEFVELVRRGRWVALALRAVTVLVISLSVAGAPQATRL